MGQEKHVSGCPCKTCSLAENDRVLSVLSEYFKDESNLERSFLKAFHSIQYASQRNSALMLSPDQVRAIDFCFRVLCTQTNVRTLVTLLKGLTL